MLSSITLKILLISLLLLESVFCLNEDEEGVVGYAPRQLRSPYFGEFTFGSLNRLPRYALRRHQNTVLPKRNFLGNWMSKAFI